MDSKEVLVAKQRTTKMLRAVVQQYETATHTATVQPLGLEPIYLHSVPVSREVAGLAAGERVLVVLLTEHNAGEAIVLCLYGGN